MLTGGTDIDGGTPPSAAPVRGRIRTGCAAKGANVTESAGNSTRPGNVPALERATSIPWEDWVALFESAGAKTLGHTEIARIAREKIPASVENPDWWAQGAAIAFEQYAGLRVPGQSSTGSFRVSASRTVEMDRDAAIESWAGVVAGLDHHLGHLTTGRRRSRTEKRTFWRANLEGSGVVEVSAVAKDEGRSVVAVEHNGLPDADSIEAWRAHWKELLAQI